MEVNLENAPAQLLISLYSWLSKKSLSKTDVFKEGNANFISDSSCVMLCYAPFIFTRRVKLKVLEMRNKPEQKWRAVHIHFSHILLSGLATNRLTFIASSIVCLIFVLSLSYLRYSTPRNRLETLRFRN